MAHWLFKSEPSVWSWDQQVAAGDAGTCWDGVRNHGAKLNLKAASNGDRGFFYHSNASRAVVGIVEVIREFYPDPTDPTADFGMIDVRAVRPLPNPVTLARIKAEPRLRNMVLVKNSRLSVQPVTDEEWTVIGMMGGL